MTGTDFPADGLMRRDVTGGNNQGNAVASLHMTIMMKIRGVLSGQNSFLIFIGVYRQHYYEENKIIRKTEISCKADNRQPCSIITAGSFRLITEDR